MLSMEPPPPAKRARVGHAPWDDDDDGEADEDELTLSTSQFDARQHPMYQLDKKRAQSAFKLKSRFEDIFEKYGKDFEGVGDEIDLRTGEVIVDNGHLQSLEDEDQDKSEDDQEEAELLQDKTKADRIRQKASAQSRPNQFIAPHLLQKDWPNAQGANPNYSFMQTFGASHPLDLGSCVAEPAWQTPDALPSLQGLPPFGSPFNNGLQPLMPMTFGPGFGLSSMLAQPYRRITTARDIGPRVPFSSESVPESHEDSIAYDEGHEQDVLIDMISDSAEVTPRQRTKKQYDTVIPFAGLENNAGNNVAESTAKVTLVSNRKPRARGRPKSNPAPDQSPVRPGSDPAPAPSTVCSSEAGTSNRLLENIDHERSPHASPASDDILENPREVTSGRRWVQEQTPITDDSSDSQSRRSTRLRKQVEHYSHITWKAARSGRTITRAVTPPPERTTTLCVELPTAPRPSKTQKSSEKVAGIQPPASDANSPTIDLVDNDHVPPAHLLDVLENPSKDVATTSPAMLILERSTSSEITVASLDVPRSSPLITEPRDKRDKLQTTTEQSADVDVQSGITAESPLGSYLPSHHTSLRASVEIDGENLQSAVAVSSDDVVHTESTGSCSPTLEFQADGEECDVTDVSVELGEEFGLGLNLPAEVPDSVGEPSPEPEHPSMLDATQPESPVIPASDSRSDSTSPKSTHGHDGVEIDLPFRPTPIDGFQDHPSVSDTSQASSPRPPRGRGRPPKSTTQSTSQSTSHPRTPKKTRKLTSLLPDLSDDEDELSILSSSVARTPTSSTSLRASFTRGVFQVPLTLASTHRRGRQPNPLLSTPRYLSLSRASSRQVSPSLPRRLPATDTGAIRYGLKRKQSTASIIHSSPLARGTQMQKSLLDGSIRSSRADSPTNSVLRTPEGSVRRCGQNGYVCERDFCFTCCK